MYKVEMTTLEIAELTNKLHKNVLTDVRSVIEKINELESEPVKIGELKSKPSSFTGLKSQLSESSYKDSTGRSLPMMVLSKDLVNVLMCGYSVEHAIKVINHINHLELENEHLSQGIAAIKDIMWEVINGQAYVSQEQALKSVGVKHPRLFIKFLKSNKAFYNSVVFERQLLSERQCNKHGDRWLKFTKAGFQWLIDEKVKIDLWVEEQKVIQKNAGKLPC